MTRNDKFNIQRRTVWRNFWQRLSGVPDLAVKLLFVALYLAGMVCVWSKQEAVSAYAQSVEFMSPIMLAAMTHIVSAYLIAGGAVLAVLMVYPLVERQPKTNCGALDWSTVPRWCLSCYESGRTRSIPV